MMRNGATRHYIPSFASIIMVAIAATGDGALPPVPCSLDAHEVLIKRIESWEGDCRIRTRLTVQRSIGPATNATSLSEAHVAALPSESLLIEFVGWKQCWKVTESRLLPNGDEQISEIVMWDGANFWSYKPDFRTLTISRQHQPDLIYGYILPVNRSWSASFLCNGPIIPYLRERTWEVIAEESSGELVHYACHRPSHTLQFTFDEGTDLPSPVRAAKVVYAPSGRGPEGVAARRDLVFFRTEEFDGHKIPVTGVHSAVIWGMGEIKMPQATIDYFKRIDFELMGNGEEVEFPALPAGTNVVDNRYAVVYTIGDSLLRIDGIEYRCSQNVNPFNVPGCFDAIAMEGRSE